METKPPAFLDFKRIDGQALCVMHFMSTVQFASQVLLNGEVFYGVPNELQILREREREREIKYISTRHPAFLLCQSEVLSVPITSTKSTNAARLHLASQLKLWTMLDFNGEFHLKDFARTTESTSSSGEEERSESRSTATQSSPGRRRSRPGGGPAARGARCPRSSNRNFLMFELIN